MAGGVGRHVHPLVPSRRTLPSQSTTVAFSVIDGTAGEYDWIPEEPQIDWGEFLGRFDTVLMGRGTWEILAEEGPGPTAGMRTFVFSTTLEEIEDERIILVRKDAADAVRRLREEEGKAIWLMGGGVLFGSLLEADLVDEIEVAVVPVLLGAGIPLLPERDGTAALELLDSRVYPSGIVSLRYALH